jgi:nitrate reductase assembly molybdenum cofactor insertion protein NarJ
MKESKLNLLSNEELAKIVNLLEELSYLTMKTQYEDTFASINEEVFMAELLFKRCNDDPDKMIELQSKYRIEYVEGD